MQIETPLKRGRSIKYNGKSVGTTRRQLGKWVFEWKQEPFRSFCTPDSTAYGMSRGLKEALEASPFELVKVGHGMIPVGALDDYDLLLPTNDVFNEPPGEPQRLITVNE